MAACFRVHWSRGLSGPGPLDLDGSSLRFPFQYNLFYVRMGVSTRLYGCDEYGVDGGRWQHAMCMHVQYQAPVSTRATVDM